MKCVVCQANAHGYHFGVSSCRACAIFFRRAIVSKRKLICYNGMRHCKLEGDHMRRGLCQLCRYNKCIEVGMTDENIQLNRDLNKQAKSQELIPSPDTSERSLQFLHVSYDIAFTCRLKQVFTEFDPVAVRPEIVSCSTLERMNIALQRHRERRTPHVKTVIALHLPDVAPYWGDEKLKAAEWFMFSKQFESLPLDSKMMFFRSKWRIWRCFERFQWSIEALGSEAVTKERKFIFADGLIIDMKNMVLDFRPLSEESSENLRRLFDPWLERFIDVVGKFISELKPRPFELTYLLCMMAFHIEELSLCDLSHELSLNFRDECSSDLHDEYIRLGMVNYMDRMTGIFHVLDKVEKMQVDYNQVVELASIFDILHKNICIERYES